MLTKLALLSLGTAGASMAVTGRVLILAANRIADFIEYRL